MINNKKIIISLILALLISFFLEITLFNYTHYATLFTSKHFGIVYSEQEQSFISNVDEYLLNKISVRNPFLLPNPLSELRFINLNTEIASIYINSIFIQGNKQRVKVIWADEESSERSIDVSIIKNLDFSNYINIYEGLKYFYPRLKKCGYIFVHDCNCALSYSGVKKAVKQFSEENDISFFPLSDQMGSVVFVK